MIHVLAALEVDPNGREEFLELFRALVPTVLAEEGCISYTPAVDVDSGIETQDALRDNVVMVVEQWESIEALKTHLAAPHMVAFRESASHLLRGLKLQVCEDQGPQNA